MLIYPETNSLTPENGWFENKEPFPFGAHLAYFQGLNLLLVSGKVYADSHTPEI